MGKKVPVISIGVGMADIDKLKKKVKGANMLKKKTVKKSNKVLKAKGGALVTSSKAAFMKSAKARSPSLSNAEILAIWDAIKDMKASKK